MKKAIKKSGQKIVRKFSLASKKTSRKYKEHVKTHFFARIANIKQVRLWIFEWFLLIVAITLFAVVQQIWNSNAYETKVFVSGGSYSEATLGQISSMNPLYASTNSEKTLARLLFSSLLTVDEAGKLGNDLARSVTPSEDAKIWTVQLRDNLFWSDGEQITADDIVFSFNLIKNPNAKTSFVADFNKVKIEKTANLEIVLSLPTTYPNFNTFLNFPVVPEHILGDVDPALIYEHSFSTKPIGSGPFLLNASQVTDQGRTVYLNRNPNYYAGKTLLDNFAIRSYETTDQIIDALNRADVNATADLRSVANPNIKNAKFYKKESAINNGVFAFFNTSTDGVLSDARLRQALQIGIDTTALRDDLAEDYELDLPMLSQQISLSFPEIPEHNKVEATKLITDAGYKVSDDGHISAHDGKALTIDLAAPNSGHLPEIASRLKTQLETLGFVVNFNSYTSELPSKEFFSSVVQPRSYDILIYEVDLGLDPDPFAYYHSSQATSSGLNLSNYRNALVDDLLLSARTTTSEKLRAAKYENFLKYWVKDVPAIGIYQSYSVYYFNRNVRTFSENNSLSTSLDRFSDVLYWASEKDFKNRTP